MALQPTIPMSPEALPKQKLYIVPSLERVPDGWNVEFLRKAPELPVRMPRSARYVGQVEWAWSPMHNRLDAYHLSLNQKRDRWCLWVSNFDDQRWRFVDTDLVASAPRAGLRDVTAAAALLRAYWAHEAGGFCELDAPHWINEGVLLDVAHIKEAIRQVWPGTPRGKVR